jgi:hypothetical protein
MAGDEMRDITADKWADDIWGITSPGGNNPTEISAGASAPKMVFYFGRGDHWVAEQTRDEIIKAKGFLSDRPNGKIGPKMVVCEDGVLHGFCIRKALVSIPQMNMGVSS